MISLTVVLGYFFTARTMLLSPAFVVFLGLLLSAPVVSVFFMTFQIVVLAMSNVYAAPLVLLTTTVF